MTKPNGKDREIVNGKKCRFTRQEYIDRFWANVSVKGPGDCWEWQAGKSNGYGWMTMFGVKDRAHRHAWRLVNGEIPEGLFVLHKCDNPPCCNPNHFFLGTDMDNFQDAKRKGRTKRPQPDNRGEKCGSNKLSENDIRTICTRLDRGDNAKQMSLEYNVRAGTIHSINAGRIWGWFTGRSSKNARRKPRTLGL